MSHDDEWPEELLNARVRIWFCPDRRTPGHQQASYPRGTVEWRAGTACCLHPNCNRNSAEPKEPA